MFDALSLLPEFYIRSRLLSTLCVYPQFPYIIILQGSAWSGPTYFHNVFGALVPSFDKLYPPWYFCCTLTFWVHFFHRFLPCSHYMECFFCWYLHGCCLPEFSVQIKCIFLRGNTPLLISMLVCFSWY